MSDNSRYISINSNLSTDIGGTGVKFYVSGEHAYDMPERDVTSIEVPGRNGNLLIDNGRYKNIQIKYDCVMPTEFGNITHDKLSIVRDFLNSARYDYVMISDSYNTPYYRLGRLVGEVNFHPMYTNQQSATFSLTFDCMPQLFLLDGMDAHDVTATIPETITNPTRFEAKPAVYAEIDDLITANTGYVVFNKNNGGGYDWLGSIRFQNFSYMAGIESGYKLKVDLERYTTEVGKWVSGKWVKSATQVGKNWVSFSGNPRLLVGDTVIVSDAVDVEIEPRWWTI